MLKLKLKRRGRAIFVWSRRIAGWLVILLLVATPAYVTIVNRLGERRAERLLADLHDYDLLLPQPRAVESGSNGAPLLRAAAWAIRPYDYEADVPVVGRADWPQFGDGFDAVQARTLREMVTRNDLAYDLVDEALQKPVITFEIPPGFVDVDKLLHVVGECRRLARWQHVRSLDAQARNDAGEATASVIDTFALGRGLNAHELLLGHLVRISVAAMADDMLESLLSRMELSDAQLQRLACAIERERQALDILDPIRGELAQAAAAIGHPRWGLLSLKYRQVKQAMIFANVYAAIAAALADQERPSIDLADIVGMERSFWEGLYLSAEDSYFAWVPGHFQLNMVAETRSVLEAVLEYQRVRGQPAARAMLTGREKPSNGATPFLIGLEMNLRMRSKLAAAEAAMAVEAYRLKHDQWPDRLGQLDVDLPVDPLGQPLRMRQTAEGLRVYSIGLNGIDDNGFSEHEDRAPDEADDQPFRLLDPARRGASPSLTSANDDDVQT